MSETSRKRTRRPRAYAPDPDAPGGEPCARAGCAEQGLYRAPKSRDRLREYQWLCLEHVRQFNAAWDFYKGMSSAQIEAQLRADTEWQRPSWPLGHNGGVQADRHIFGEKLDKLRPSGPPPGHPDAVPPGLRQPLALFGLAWPVTFKQVKTRYKELAKLHHPDANGGDKAAEERLKNINQAYAALRAHFSPLPVMASP